MTTVKDNKELTSKEVESMINEAVRNNQKISAGDFINLLKRVKSVHVYFDIRQAKKNFPEVVERLRRFMVDNSQGVLDDIDEESFLIGVFTNPRIIYDFLDSEGIYLGVGYDIQDQSWGYTIGKETIFSGDTRHDTEREAWYAGLKALNDRA